MKKYFTKDYETVISDDIHIFLKKKYDESDDIFERRFENIENKNGQKARELERLIANVNTELREEKNVNSKLVALTLGNAYLRLAQCQNEIFEKSRENYQKAIFYLEEHIDYLNMDEIDLLLILNKGKYFRNTAEIGKKSDYDRACDIFGDVANRIENADINDERKFHLLLDAKINIGRVKRYSYEFKEAQKLFLSIILGLEKYIDESTKKKLYGCNSLKIMLQNAESDDIVEKYVKNIEEHEVSAYIWEYLLQSLIHIGIIYRKKKEYEKAVEIFTLIIDIDSSKDEKNIDALNNLGVCYRKLGDEEGKKLHLAGKNMKRLKRYLKS